MSKELFEKYKDVLNKPLGELTDKEWKRLNRFLDENNKGEQNDDRTQDA